MIMFPPKSCDTFVVLPPANGENCIIFGKNSDRPMGEVQEVIYVPATDHNVPCSLKCTYINVAQVAHTYATILSKPSWMWGAEMGANEHGVCIGNEAVWTKLNDDNDKREKLIGMDLLRLALERAKTAEEALRIIVHLIDLHGMGGNCSDIIPDFTYHNSFLIADPYEAWVLECAGEIWAAEKVTSGTRNISNELSIDTKIDMKCDNLEEFAEEKGFWNSKKGPLNFRLAFGLEEDEFKSHRYNCGKRLLSKYSKDGDFKMTDMVKVLRDKSSGICMSSGSFVSTGSQVSIIRKPESGEASCHWFTATPDPDRSIYKPFIFSEVIDFPMEVVSPEYDEQFKTDRRHNLYRIHEQYCKKPKMDSAMWKNKIKEIEEKYINYATEVARNFNSRQKDCADLFKKAVKEELQIYV